MKMQRKKFKIIWCLVIGVTLIGGCEKRNYEVEPDTRDILKNSIEKVDTVKIQLTINHRNFTATLENNETTREFLQRLPLNIYMNELNGNEKYYYFDSSLPNNPIQPEKIQVGDIMLYGDNCLVLFYDTFETNYSYTKIGRLDDVSDVQNMIGTGTIEVSISK